MQYEAPETLEVATALLANAGGEARVLAGGTDLLIQMRGDMVEPSLVVDIKNVAEMVDDKLIRHWNQHTNEVEEPRDWLPEGPLTIGGTAGASCPNNLIEDVICRLLELRGTSAEEFLSSN